jgi:drug/metabolite transporter (DMT)-like permease
MAVFGRPSAFRGSRERLASISRKPPLKTDPKILLVLLPGALLGAGAGALVAAFQFASAGAFASVQQTTGIIMMIGSIILRILLSERGLKLSDYGGLGINGICVLLSGVIAISLTSGVLETGNASAMAAIAAALLAAVSALALTAAGAFAFAKLRRKS